MRLWKFTWLITVNARQAACSTKAADSLAYHVYSHAAIEQLASMRKATPLPSASQSLLVQARVRFYSCSSSCDVTRSPDPRLPILLELPILPDPTVRTEPCRRHPTSYARWTSTPRTRLPWCSSVATWAYTTAA